MAQAVSISLKKFTESVNSAVKAAAAKHPKFQLEPAHGITVSYLIRGFPVPDGVLRNVSLPEVAVFRGRRRSACVSSTFRASSAPADRPGRRAR